MVISNYVFLYRLLRNAKFVSKSQGRTRYILPTLAVTGIGNGKLAKMTFERNSCVPPFLRDIAA
jgi:hypothetical protein